MEVAQTPAVADCVRKSFVSTANMDRLSICSSCGEYSSLGCNDSEMQSIGTPNKESEMFTGTVSFASCSSLGLGLYDLFALLSAQVGWALNTNN